ncbi:hypothetical protein [Polynucleobacter necessarius]|uniref:hypothetical protein n=1 Tax=Polynucleobacter necessarius TaxID=576610 RepID=UPI001E509A87|nr:hypothetical protein [Polynucleobacter necessarius]
MNPPAKNKHYYFENNKIAPTAEEWLEGAKQIPGSWWPDYTKWLEQFGGEKKAARITFGNSKYKKKWKLLPACMSKKKQHLSSINN